MSDPTPRLTAVDAYISSARPFAQPILRHLRDTIHRAAPEVAEAIKWSRPFFLYRSVILGNMAAFTAHCSFGLWGAGMAQTLRAEGIDSHGAMGTFGRLTSLDDLPPTPALEAYIRHAAGLIAAGTRTQSVQRVAKPGRSAPVSLPQALTDALDADPFAAGKFNALSPGCRREYATWIGEAKRDDTRAKRLAATLASIAQGKPHTGQRSRTPA